MIRYFLVRLASLIWQKLPVKAGYGLACLLADAVYLSWHRGRAQLKENMSHVLGPGADERMVSQMARRALRNYFKSAMDFVRLPTIRGEEINGRVAIRGWENIDRALAEGKGAIFIGLHMGNWDLAAAALTQRNYPINVVADSFTPARLNAFIERTRAQKGVKVIPVERVARKALGVLRRNEVLALLIDRPSSHRGVPVRFFDSLTRVPAGAATLALKTGARVMLGGVIRLPDDSFMGMVEDSLPFQPTGDLKSDIQALTQRIMSALEKMVRQYPDQWYMFRRMWDGTAPSTELNPAV